MCTTCTKRLKQKIQRSQTTGHGRVVKVLDENAPEKLDQLHQNFCEVCQKEGKLILCDACPKSFHAACIEHLVSLESLAQASEWKCPCCMGVDLFSNDTGFRLTEEELEARMLARNEALRKRARRAVRRRNQWLHTLVQYIQPFVGKHSLKAIKQDAARVDGKISRIHYFLFFSTLIFPFQFLVMWFGDLVDILFGFRFQKMILVPYFFFLVGSFVVARMGMVRGCAALRQFGSNVAYDKCFSRTATTTLPHLCYVLFFPVCSESTGDLTCCCVVAIGPNPSMVPAPRVAHPGCLRFQTF